MGIFKGLTGLIFRLESVPIAATAALERHVKTKIMLGLLLVVLGTAFGVAARISRIRLRPANPT